MQAKHQTSNSFAPLPSASGSGQEDMAAPASASSSSALASSALDDPAASELLRSEHAPSNNPCCSLLTRVRVQQLRVGDGRGWFVAPS